MSRQWEKCSLCEDDVLISCTNADYSPAYYNEKPVCSDCYSALLEEFNLREATQ